MLPDNPFRGETSVEIGGETYRLVFDVSAFIFAQQATGKGMEALVSEFEASADDLLTLRVMLWAGLQRHHPRLIGEVDELMTTAGPSKVRFAVSQALVAAFGVAKEGKNSGKARKQKAATG